MAASAVVGHDLRDPLRAATLLELSSSAEDLDCALSGEHAEAMIESRTRLEAACRLLDDLGWAANDARHAFGITVASDQLTPLLERIDRNTRRALVGYARLLRSGPGAEETPSERQERLEAIREFADLDLDMLGAARAVRSAVERNTAPVADEQSTLTGAVEPAAS